MFCLHLHLGEFFGSLCQGLPIERGDLLSCAFVDLDGGRLTLGDLFAGQLEQKVLLLNRNLVVGWEV